jgi:plasmid stabilization system protein ParE
VRDRDLGRDPVQRIRDARPVHVLFYRTRQPDSIEIVRILHERMDPVRHLGPPEE